MAGGEPGIVTTAAIVITAAIGTDASERACPDSPLAMNSRNVQVRFNYAIGRCFRRSRARRLVAGLG
jgi:hypothetical protein